MTPPTRRSPVQRRSEANVAAIVAATRALLADHEPADLTVRAVAARAGIAGPTVYRYFRDLDEVVDVVLDDHARRTAEAVTEALAGSRLRSVAGVFELVARTYLTLYRAQPELLAAVRSPTLAERLRVLEAATDRSLVAQLADHLEARGLVGSLGPRGRDLLAAHWAAAGSMLSAALRADRTERAVMETELIVLVRWMATRY